MGAAAAQAAATLLLTYLYHPFFVCNPWAADIQQQHSPSNLCRMCFSADSHLLLLLCWLFPLLQAYADGPEARQVDPAVGAAAGAIGAATGLPISALTHGKLPAAAAACECSTVRLDTVQPSCLLSN
jgi:hypothetical protein